MQPPYKEKGKGTVAVAAHHQTFEIKRKKGKKSR